MTDKSIIERNEELLSSEMDDELVMMDLESNNYYGLNRVGKDIWEKIEEPTTLEELCNNLTTRYNVSFDKCKEDITPFLTKLQEMNIVKIS